MGTNKSVHTYSADIQGIKKRSVLHCLMAITCENIKYSFLCNSTKMYNN